MFRIATAAFAVLGLTLAWPTPAGRAADAPDLAGTWKVDHDGYNEFLTIAQDKDKGDWSAGGVFKQKGKEVGAWKGVAVQFADGKLTCTQRWSKKPDTTWSEDTKLTASVSGDKLSFTWDNGGNNGTREMTRVKATAGDGGDLAGTWKVDHDGYAEVWAIQTAKGQWDVKGIFLKKGRQVGAWVGVDPTFADGKLTCTQKYIAKPDPNWSDGNKLTVQAAGDKVDFTWDNGTQSGTREMTRVK